MIKTDNPGSLGHILKEFRGIINSHILSDWKAFMYLGGNKNKLWGDASKPDLQDWMAV